VKILIIGAAGLVGRALVQRLTAESRHQLTLLDRVPYMSQPDISEPDDLRVHVGDFGDSDVVAPLLAETDAVVLLASVLGGAAEADYGLARRVNIDSTLKLFESLRRPSAPARVVFASTIAVFGVPMPLHVDDSTVPAPSMIYGAQKLMMEIALSHFTRRGWLNAMALRLPGIMARAEDNGTQRAGFMNRLFYNFRTGQDVRMPISEDATMWIQSVGQVAWNFAHALEVPAARLGDTRAFTLPALRVRIGDLIVALRRRYPASRTRVIFDIDADLTAQFGNYPLLKTPLADSLGFLADANLDSLVAHAMPA
jgi:nucleoside-diphosphate-sugar epimerase